MIKTQQNIRQNRNNGKNARREAKNGEENNRLTEESLEKWGNHFVWTREEETGLIEARRQIKTSRQEIKCPDCMSGKQLKQIIN